MKRRSKWTKRIGFLLAPALAATTTIAASSNQVGASDSDSAGGNNTVDAADASSRFEICTPDYGSGKIFSQTFKIEGVDGNPITDSTGLTFEITHAGTATDVTESVVYVEDAMDWTQGIPLGALFDVPLTTYFSPIKAPGLFGLSCTSATITTDENDQESTQFEPFPAGTTIVAKRNGTIIASSDLSGRNSMFTDDEIDDPFFNQIGSLIGDIFQFGLDCDIIQSNVQTANDLFPCTPFSDMYNSLIDATGVRLHPSFAYFATIFPSLLLYGCLFDSDLDSCFLDGEVPWFFLEPLAAMTQPTNSHMSSLFHQMADKIEPMQSVTSRALQSTDGENAVNTMIDFDYCIANRALALLPLRDVNGDEPPLFNLTAVGRGMADSLSDPRINQWPEIDVCLYGDQDTEYFFFFSALIIIELYIVQLFAVDIPMGNTNILTNMSELQPIQMKSINRIPWTWNDNTLAAPRVGKPYADAVSANGSPAPTYSITSGALPTGLSLNSTTGAITGMPKRQGTFTFTIAATNAVGAMSQSFTLATNNIKPRLTAKRDNLLVTFKGRVSTSFKGKRVSLEEFKYGKWRTIQRVDVNKNGRFTASTFTQWKTRYRVVAGVSRSRVVTR